MIPTPSATPTVREYHQGDRWSSSRVKTFARDPGLAFGMYRAEPRIYTPPPPTPAQMIGSAVHDLLAAAGGEESLIHPVKDKSRSGSEYKKAWSAFPERLVLTSKEHDEARRCADALLEPRTWSARLGKAILVGLPGFSEYYHAWTDETGVECMQLCDRVAEGPDFPIYGELKTAKNDDVPPDRFFWVSRSNGYDDQMAFNLRGLRRLLPSIRGVWVVVGKQPSYPVSVQMAGEEVLRSDRGRRGRLSPELEIEATLERLAECLKDLTGAKWCSPWEKRTNDGEISELEPHN